MILSFLFLDLILECPAGSVLFFLFLSGSYVYRIAKLLLSFLLFVLILECQAGSVFFFFFFVIFISNCPVGSVYFFLVLTTECSVDSVFFFPRSYNGATSW